MGFGLHALAGTRLWAVVWNASWFAGGNNNKNRDTQAYLITSVEKKDGISMCQSQWKRQKQRPQMWLLVSDMNVFIALDKSVFSRCFFFFTADSVNTKVLTVFKMNGANSESTKRPSILQLDRSEFISENQAHPPCQSPTGGTFNQPYSSSRWHNSWPSFTDENVEVTVNHGRRPWRRSRGQL